MAKGYGWGQAFLDGMREADVSMTAAKDREASDRRAELERIQLSEAQAGAEEKFNQRLLAGERKNTQQLAAQDQNLRPFEVYAKAADIRKQAGDLDGFEEYSKKSDAHRAQWYSTELEKAYRSNDMASGLALLNDFPDGVKYDVQPQQDGTFVGVAMGDDGKERGRQPFKSTDEFWSFVALRAKPGDIYETLRKQRQDKLDADLKGAQIKETEAGTEAKTQQGLGFKLNNKLVQEFGPQQQRAEINRTNAQAGAAGANAAESAARAENVRHQTATAPTKDEANAERSRVRLIDEAGRRARAWNSNPINAANPKDADSFMDEVARDYEKAGAATRPKSVVRVPQKDAKNPGTKNFSNLWN